MKFTKSTYEDMDFSREHIEVTEMSSLRFVRCKFRWTDFTDVETIFKCTFDTCDFVNARLNGVTAKNTGFLTCIFTNASFFATTFECCNMLGSDFRNSDCALLKIDGGDWSYTNLHKLSFQKQEFIGIRFCGADLSETHFNQCKIKDCEFEEAIVKETSFYKCDMRGSLLHGMDLFEINLKDALLSLEQCVLTAEYITGCRFKADENQ